VRFLPMIVSGMAILAAISPISSAAQSIDKSAKAQMGLEAYVPEKFEAALAAKKPVLVMVSASWCPVCRVQENVVRRLLAPQPAYADVAFFRVDFDSQKPEVKYFKADTQSTLITFRNGKETGRMVGSTDTAKIKAFTATLSQ
jgi:thioredoxin 1